MSFSDPRFCRAYRSPVKLSETLTQFILTTIVLTAVAALCMSDEAIQRLRQETSEIFYHGYNNYLKHAFPEDELSPLSCKPLTRDRNNEAHVELNDVLGNYSLTLIDSLSTLAIIASTPVTSNESNEALEAFQDGVAVLIEYYGDGTQGPSGHGKRARGFNLDSKVQVFETVIRGLGGLLSAHLFAIGELPINGYNPLETEEEKRRGILWPNGVLYDGQLLRLAHDLGERLLPAFQTPTGLPYPRVNLMTGVPFYAKSFSHGDADGGQCDAWNTESPEVTETCSAGAGSLVLEMSTLSSLTGDSRFANVAAEAFWAVWARRSDAGLIGAGIDAETGEWVAPFTGIGAGIDSFFEYAFKSYILLSGIGNDTSHVVVDNSDAFLSVWRDSHASIRRHVYRSSAYHHPHYVQADLYNGATRALWLDSLSAYYPGLLTIAGELEEAIESHLLYSALWSRYAALPERWSVATGNIESELRWWGGRPEFIESTWYLYRATRDPWYLHVGEMVVRDIKRRCWTACGWAGLQDVRTGEQTDRMESFFLGETAKYLYLLFDPAHPLNNLDAPYVFTTEGHPLIIPRARGIPRAPGHQKRAKAKSPPDDSSPPSMCPLPPPAVPLSFSATAARVDIFHAASLARLYLTPTPRAVSSVLESVADPAGTSATKLHSSPTNFTYYPWTLPVQLIPPFGISSKMALRITFDLSFPAIPKSLILTSPAFQRTDGGITIHSLNGLRLRLVREPPEYVDPVNSLEDTVRIFAVANVALGRDEHVFMTRNLAIALNGADPHFTRIRDVRLLDLVVDCQEISPLEAVALPRHGNATDVAGLQGSNDTVSTTKHGGKSSPWNGAARETMSQFEDLHIRRGTESSSVRRAIPAALSAGPGAGHLPDVDVPATAKDVALPWTTFYFSDETCDRKLPKAVPMEYQIIVMKRGQCSFSEKLRNIPSYAPSSSALQLVVIISFTEHDLQFDEPSGASRHLFPEDDGHDQPMIQPFLDQIQLTPTGIPRRYPIPMIMIRGGARAYDMLKTAKAVGISRRWYFYSQGLKINNLLVV